MRKVVLRTNEQYKYDVIKKLVDTNGNKKKAALKLNCTIRAINRLIISANKLKSPQIISDDSSISY